MFNYQIRVKQLLLLIGDFLVFQLAVPIMLLLRYGKVTQEAFDQHTLPFLIVSLMWLVGFYVAGLYDLKLTREPIKFVRTYFEGVLANTLVSLAFFYMLPIFGITPRTNLILFVVTVLLLDYLWRLAFNRLIARTMFRTRLLLIGPPQEAAVMDALIRDAGLGFDLVAVVQTAPGSQYDNGKIAWYASPYAIQNAVKEQRVDTIVISHTPEDVPGLQDALYQTLFSSVTMVDRAGFEEIATGRVPLDHISQSWFLSHLNEGDKAAYEGIKRVLDLVLAIPTAVIIAVLYPFIALLVTLSSRGPILIRQTRIGKNGKPFTLYKFRTMVANAEQVGRPQFATQNDPRVTRMGRFLRHSHLDELPQIWNVIRGDMSLIGPRPERPEFVQQLTQQMPFYALRHLTRPGVTGWAQVNFPYAATLEDNIKKLQYDLYYIKHRSLMLDLAILLKTIRIMLKRIGQ